MIVDIDTANRLCEQNRHDQINEAQRRKSRLDVLLFVAMDQRCLSKGAAAKAMEHIDNLGRQLYGWAAQAKNQMLGQGSQKAEPSK